MTKLSIEYLILVWWGIDYPKKKEEKKIKWSEENRIERMSIRVLLASRISEPPLVEARLPAQSPLPLPLPLHSIYHWDQNRETLPLSFLYLLRLSSSSTSASRSQSPCPRLSSPETLEDDSALLRPNGMDQKLELQLRELGSKLESPPSTKDALVKLLKVCHLCKIWSSVLLLARCFPPPVSSCFVG